MIFLRQSLAVVAYEGARLAVRPDSTLLIAEQRCQEVISERGIQNATVAVTPPNINAQSRGTPIRVTVQAPCSDNRVLPLKFFSNSLSASAVMAKE